MKPLDPAQFTLWYRLRRMPRALFVAGIGGILTTAIIIVFFAMTSRLFGVDYGRNVIIILTVFLAITVTAAYDWNMALHGTTLRRNTRRHVSIMWL